MADRNRQLEAAETAFTREVDAALTGTAEEFTDALTDATELVAARFSVGRIARMWQNRVTGLVRRLLGVSEEAARAAVEDAGAGLPDGWDDLPGRYDDGTLPDGLGQYATTTEHLLNAVGDRLADATRRELAAGLNAGEDIDQLRDRLRAAFTREGTNLGPGREHRIAATEATRAWNTATLEAARATTGPGRALVKQWITRHDRKVRHTHAAVDGQIRLLDEMFAVGGARMQAPGDPSAPAAEVVNCRCRLGIAPQQASASFEIQAPSEVASSNHGLRVMGGRDIAAAGAHTGAMIALMPTAEDAQRLAFTTPGAEPPHELHLTLAYLGEAADWTPDHRAALHTQVAQRAGYLDPGHVQGRVFGSNQWNADREDPCWVWSVGDDPDRSGGGPMLDDAHNIALDALSAVPGALVPAQHTPWAGHIAAAYTGSPWPLRDMNSRLGPVRFDRLRVAFADEYTDFPLEPPAMEDPMNEPDQEERHVPRPWSTPGGTALAFENEQTGDGRVFRPGSLYWDGTGPWPLQHADEMLMGHEGAELAGAILTLGRDGNRIPGTGVLYPNRPAGADALMLLEEGAPLGVSVDLDDVSMEFVDASGGSEDAPDDVVLLACALPSASFLRLDDGSWMVTATATAAWTASGSAMSRTASATQLVTGADGQVPADAVRAAFGTAGVLTAGAGDPDAPDGLVLHSETSGDLLMRVTRGRVRGATLVAMPAYAQARIVLDDDPAEHRRADDEGDDLAAGSGPSEAHMRVVRYVRAAPVPVGAREVAKALSMRMETVRGHLARAAKSGRLVRLARGVYCGPANEGADLAASVTNDGDGTGDDGMTAALLGELEASAWTAMREADPMPADWFREPTLDELPHGSGGVHYAKGRIYGWVAQAGEPHAGHPGKNLTIESLGKLDLTHFLRARFALDDGTTVKAGAFTMNVGHHRDGAECDTAACQFDDTRTVAGIVTVGMNKRGLWFSGAAAPWLSEWDRSVFAACQPSYHMKQNAGRWQLRAVLSVPVPGHSSPLIATAVAERSNLALAASAAAVLTHPDTVQIGPDTIRKDSPDRSGRDPDAVPDTSGQSDGTAALTEALLASDNVLDVLLAAMDRRQEQRAVEARAEAERLAASVIAPARADLAAGHTTAQEGAA